MIVSRCNFGPLPTALEKGKFEDLVQVFAISLLKNWQILGHYDLAWNEGSLWCYAPLSRRNSFKETYLSNWGKSTFSELVANSVQPSWEILDDEAAEEIADWQREKEFVLFTHFLDESSPLVSLTSSHPIALYSLPISDATREEAYSWAIEYREFDSKFMSTFTSLELACYRQLAEVNSAVSAKGRELCSIIEKASKIPTYYYLHRYWGSMQELTLGRPCPGCGRDWMIHTVDSHNGFYDFCFRCSSCRLVSHHPKTFDEPARARIGKWKNLTKNATKK